MKKYISDENDFSACLASKMDYYPLICTLSSEQETPVAFSGSWFIAKVASHVHRITSPQKVGSDWAMPHSSWLCSHLPIRRNKLPSLVDDVISDPLEEIGVGIPWLQMAITLCSGCSGWKGYRGGCDLSEMKRNQEERECLSFVWCLLWDFWLQVRDVHFSSHLFVFLNSFIAMAGKRFYMCKEQTTKVREREQKSRANGNS